MYQPYLGEIRMFAGTFAPRNWALCNGQLVPIQQNTALFSLLGTTYGGNGQTTFALPNLQGMSPVGAGAGAGPGLTWIDRGQVAGSATVTLVQSELPAHTHSIPAVDGVGTSANPSGAVPAQSGRGRARAQLYGPVASSVSMSAAVVAPAGGGQPHENMPPFLVVNVVICLAGLWPPRP
ncbi:phage tail protein [Actinotalea fermentans]|uniref:Tail Collar domain-containing protein n=1 Tax=Actinotalea fermentans TaxID=43671 RepID=A0A511YYE7_9CELL|nr:tail fiber protein [Actinotalea fermentans]KGM17865.1 hypothetical protein N867_05610 [Actinotalea fermentans ATCC 43279 = JCM 9966 = DSM 3133]GEN80209.1 tail Collar domain-containing protein [Actinotalea fermentans]